MPLIPLIHATRADKRSALNNHIGAYIWNVMYTRTLLVNITYRMCFLGPACLSVCQPRRVCIVLPLLATFICSRSATSCGVGVETHKRFHVPSERGSIFMICYCMLCTISVQCIVYSSEENRTTHEYTLT